MPVQLLKIIKEQSETLLPSHLQKENLQDLQEGCDYTNRYIQGIITLSYPLTKLRDGTDFFKIVLQDSDNLCSQINSVNVLIYGKMAEDCAKIIRHGVKKSTRTYIRIYSCFRNCFSHMYVDFFSCLSVPIPKIRNSLFSPFKSINMN